jgi:hypothetical protein
MVADLAVVARPAVRALHGHPQVNTVAGTHTRPAELIARGKPAGLAHGLRVRLFPCDCMPDAQLREVAVAAT